MAASNKGEIILIAVFSSMIFSAPLSSSEATGESDCQSTISSLAVCYSYIMDSSSSTPPSQCCNSLKNALQTYPICLCEILNDGGLNKTRVLELPKSCNLQTPPVSNCYTLRGSSGSHAPHTPTPTAGYSTKISYSALLAAASFAGILTFI